MTRLRLARAPHGDRELAPLGELPARVGKPCPGTEGSGQSVIGFGTGITVQPAMLRQVPPPSPGLISPSLTFPLLPFQCGHSHGLSGLAGPSVMLSSSPKVETETQCRRLTGRSPKACPHPHPRTCEWDPICKKTLVSQNEAS